MKLGLNEYLKSTGTSEIGFTLSPGLLAPASEDRAHGPTPGILWKWTRAPEP